MLEQQTNCKRKELKLFFKGFGGDAIWCGPDYEANMGYGGLGNDKITGSYGSDSLYGGGGHDTINGSYGGDCMLGNAGDDKLFGVAGNDRLDGGAGWGDAASVRRIVACADAGSVRHGELPTSQT